MDVDTEINNFDEDSIEPCRTCGVFFTKSQDVDRDIVKPIFSPILKDTDREKDMPDILQQLRDWNMEVAQDDGRPQYMCVVCIAEFRKVLKFKRSCLEAQQQYEELEIRPFNINIKREIDVPSEQEEKFVGFVYLSDEDSSEEDGSTRVCAAFDIPHVPIKEEHMARVPEPALYPPPIAKLPPKASFRKSQLDDGSDVVAIDDESNGDEGNENHEDIIKFTYEDIVVNDTNLTLPLPLAETRVYCKLCTYESANQDQHMDHMRRVHMLKDCECHICGKKFINAPESRLKFHMKWHKLQRHLKCPICGFFCNSKDSLKEHNLAVHSRTKCQFCGKKIKHKMLQNHINLHLREREAELALKLTSMMTTAASSTAITLPSFIQCAFCEYTFGTAKELQDHVLATHKLFKMEPATPPLPTIPTETNEDCELDANLDKSETIQDYSNVSHSDLRRSESPQSSVILESSSTSYTEMSSSTKSTYNCPICGKSFNLKIKLNRHFRKHNTELF